MTPACLGRFGPLAPTPGRPHTPLRDLVADFDASSCGAFIALVSHTSLHSAGSALRQLTSLSLTVPRITDGFVAVVAAFIPALCSLYLRDVDDGSTRGGSGVTAQRNLPRHLRTADLTNDGMEAIATRT